MTGLVAQAASYLEFTELLRGSLQMYIEAVRMPRCLFVTANLIRQLNHLHPAEHGHFKEWLLSFSTLPKLKISRALSQQSPYEQWIKAVTRKIMEMSKKERKWMLYV